MFKDRTDAGEQLAKKLLEFKKQDNAYVCGLLRGGIVVADVVSRVLHLPLFALPVKKISNRADPELALGAAAQDTVFWDERFGLLPISEQKVLEEKARSENKRREEVYHLTYPDVSGKTVIVVDDGVATGATAYAAALFFQKRNAHSVLATPVIAKDTYKWLKRVYKNIIALKMPSTFRSVSEFYKQFPQVSDQEVLEILEKSSSSTIS